ncbi:hypothetical protein [Butyrivibrio fibrisolvens]|uniref:hypothetical protein n=1 Tax=Butyrivibrio fibrisolvens TaxID=831 RepID=UPI00040C03ED|nr:hypothetical protein [Butyrivibrio fibrisolvens]
MRCKDKSNVIELKNVYLYGAGKGSELFFAKFDARNKYIVRGIVDSNEEMKGQLWRSRIGSNVEEFQILSIEDIEENQGNSYIITVKYWSALEVYGVLSRKGISDDEILYYDRDNNTVENIDTVRFSLGAKEIERDYYIRQVQYSMLCELFYANEFNNCESIAIVGTKEERNIIKDFIVKLDPNIKITCLDIVDKFKHYDKTIFVGENYMECINEYNALFDDRSWIVLPIYDVARCIF